MSLNGNGVVECSLLGSEGGAQSAAEEDKHPDEAEDPNDKRDVEVVCHGPGQAYGGRIQRACADSVPFCEQEGSDDTKKNELEEAGEEGAVDGADSPSVPPGANEHANGIDANNCVCNAHKNGHYCELRALGETVDITVFIKFYLLLQEIPI